MKCRTTRKREKARQVKLDDFVEGAKDDLSMRELATAAAEEFPDLGLCPGNQAEGLDLIQRQERRRPVKRRPETPFAFKHRGRWRSK